MNEVHSTILETSGRITLANRVDHIAARLGYKRMGHRVEPGLYALGSPTATAPVLVSANYTLSFDALRSALAGSDAYILVLDTKGVNVWCAAGEGTFGTDELVKRIQATRLDAVVRHRTLILPQLSAPGVAAHEVRKRSGWQVEYGPVRASDLPAYLETHQATPEMRRVRFGLRDRLALIPIEVVHLLPIVAIAALLAFLATGSQLAILFVTSTLGAVILFPILLPWLPTKDFSSKGFILGWLLTLPGSILGLHGSSPGWRQLAVSASQLLAFPAVTAFLALNFTGSTTFTSRTGVRREIFRYIPIMAWSLGVGVLISIAVLLARRLGG